MRIPELVIVIATVILVAVMISKSKIGTTKEKMVGLGRSVLKLVLFFVLFTIFTPFVLAVVYRIAPEENVQNLAEKDGLYFYVLQQKGDSYTMKRYHRPGAEKDGVSPVAFLTDGRKKINIDNSSGYYAGTPSGQSGVRVTFSRGTDSFTYDVRDGKIHPVARKMLNGGWPVVVSLLLAAIAAALAPRCTLYVFKNQRK